MRKAKELKGGGEMDGWMDGCMVLIFIRGAGEEKAGLSWRHDMCDVPLDGKIDNRQKNKKKEAWELDGKL